MKHEINASKRKVGPKSEVTAIRANGRVPGVVYGLKKNPVAVDVPHTPLLKIAGNKNPNQIITLKYEDTTEEVLVKEFVWHKVKTAIIDHVDFIRIDSNHPVVVKVPVVTTGVPVGVKTQGGQFSDMKKWVKVKCNARDIPPSFEQDISDMEAGTVFYTKELQFDKGQILTPGKTALYGISKGRKKDEAA